MNTCWWSHHPETSTTQRSLTQDNFHVSGAIPEGQKSWCNQTVSGYYLTLLTATFMKETLAVTAMTPRQNCNPTPVFPNTFHCRVESYKKCAGRGLRNPGENKIWQMPEGIQNKRARMRKQREKQLRHNERNRAKDEREKNFHFLENRGRRPEHDPIHVIHDKCQNSFKNYISSPLFC